MRAVAILGVIIFLGLAMLFLKMGCTDYQKEKEGETLMYPAWSGFMGFFILIVASILCLIYAIGLWDAFVAWGNFGQPKYPVLKQF